jgi:hypothetical protein
VIWSRRRFEVSARLKKHQPRLGALVFLLWIAGAGFTVGMAAGSTNEALSLDAWEPITSYRERQIEGWRVLVNKQLLAETNLCDATLKLMSAQLYQITRVVPAGPLAKLREIPIWIERSDERFPCIVYHESPDWLREHGINPKKAGAAELANPANFLAWTREQPWMVLHELAHGYHQRFLGHDHKGIRRCYEKAKTSGTTR